MYNPLVYVFIDQCINVTVLYNQCKRNQTREHVIFKLGPEWKVTV